MTWNEPIPVRTKKFRIFHFNKFYVFYVLHHHLQDATNNILSCWYLYFSFFFPWQLFVNCKINKSQKKNFQKSISFWVWQRSCTNAATIPIKFNRKLKCKTTFIVVWCHINWTNVRLNQRKFELICLVQM